MPITLGDLALRDVVSAVAVAEASHFGRAAERLGLPQPTLSQQVQRVERALGTALFERTGRRVLITPDGQRLLPLLRDLLDRAAALADFAAQARPSVPLRVGVIPTLGPAIVPHLLLDRPGQAPLPPLTIREHTTTELLSLLREGSLDAALLSLPIPTELLTIIPIIDEPFRLVVRRGHPLASSPRLVPARLLAHEMVLLGEGHCLRDQALSLCRSKGSAAPRVIAASLDVLKYLVAAGEGYSLLPLTACRLTPPLDELLEIRSFDERQPQRRLAMCARDSSPRLEDVRSLARSIAQRLLAVFGPMGLRPVPAAQKRTGSKPDR
jgi:LysR family hydrogen peroxide-inducible transcriptional activator